MENEQKIIATETTTDKEQQCLDIIKITGNPSLASKITYNMGFGDMIRQRPKLKRQIIKILEKAGIKEKFLAGKLKSVIDYEPDNNTVLKALDMGFKLHGSYAPEQVEVQADFDIWRHLSVEDIKREIVEIIKEPESDKGV